MSASLLSRSIDGVQAAVQRLRNVLWAIVQASAAAGLAWYIAHDVLGHWDPFFAPITAAVCLSASNLFHARRAVQNISGVALGIVIGAAVQELLGTEWFAIGVAVLVALCVAVLLGRGFIGDGLTFANQAASSAILVMALSPDGDRLFQRLQEALIGGGLAIAFSLLLFPANPLALLRDARIRVLGALDEILTKIADTLGGRAAVMPGWPHSAVDQVQERLGELAEARASACNLARIAPRRWTTRSVVRCGDQQAAHLALLAGSVLHLARTATPACQDGDWDPQPVQVAVGDLVAGLSLAERDPDTATGHVTAAGHCVTDADSATCSTTDVILANVVQTCVDDLLQVITLQQQQRRP
jgi:uncharacterized membrane protein YgaE (UPF0421/DUF939 family)